MHERICLHTLLEKCDAVRLQGPSAADTYIHGVAVDSRSVSLGTFFVALRGGRSDGHSFLKEAVDRGAVALLIEKGNEQLVEEIDEGIAVYVAVDNHSALGEVAAALYNHPARSLRCIGITGTNGKTTISYLLESILEDQGERVGVIGTVNYRYTGSQEEKVVQAAQYTTPESLALQEVLRKMVDSGVTTVIMEVSSHALSQQRLGTVRFDVALFTNLSHDHLDYHHSMEEYFQAKTMLFLNYLKEDGKAIVAFKDSDDALENRWPSALAVLLDEKNVEYVTCGRRQDGLIVALDMKVEIGGIEMTLDTPAGRISLVSPLVGRFNGDNILSALSVASLLKFDLHAAVQSLAGCSGAPGRLEKVMPRQDVAPKVVAFVDYAHTPDALLNVLTTLKGVPHKRLLCVFGCGGDRDRMKRPQMGRIAARLADIIVVTDDNPRSESSEAIIGEIMDGVSREDLPRRSAQWLAERGDGSGCVVIPDRKEAIHLAVKSASSDDIVLIAGKGHEKYQLTPAGRRYFDDSLEVREALASWDVETISDALGVATETDGPGSYFDGISTDSRAIAERQVFVALRGENFDGHAYVDKAIDRGAAGVVVSEDITVKADSTVFVYKVADTLEALGQLAAYRRKMMAEQSSPLVVGITGSTGKTTVKEMTAQVFAKQWPDTPYEPTDRVLKTQGNFNNLIGLPLSLLPLQLKHRAVILEMGMNQPGEINRLARIADPDISCIVNVHGAHLQGLGSIEGVAREKGQLFENTRKDGTLVVNLDDPYVKKAAAKGGANQIGWSMTESADITCSDMICGDDGCLSFTLIVGGVSQPVQLKVPGVHNVANALAAAAISHAAGIDAAVIAEGLRAFSAASKRMEVVRAGGGYSILNDTYNANPASMAAGIAALASMKGGRKIAVLGDMLELGEDSAEAHRQVGIKVAEHCLSCLVLAGDFAEYTVQGAVEGGMDRDKIMVFSNKDDIPGWIQKLETEGLLAQDAWILVKGSRGMQLETVVEKLAASN